MRIGGFQRLSLIDFPGLVAATVFTQGCNFRCGYCHNPELVIPDLFQVPITPDVILEYLNSRRKKLEGIVITGGEPTLQHGLVDFIVKIKTMGFAVKLDTNGSHPEVIASLFSLKLLDYVAMDIKSSLKNYGKVIGVTCDTAKIQESIDIIINSGISYQFRTTMVKASCQDEDLKDIQSLIETANHYVIQPVMISQKMIDGGFKEQSQYTSVEIEKLKARYDKCFR